MRFKSERQRRHVMALLKSKGIKEKPIAYEETKRYHRIRVKSPKLFQSKTFRTVDIGRKGGMKAIVGRPKGKKTTMVQSYLIPK